MSFIKYKNPFLLDIKNKLLYYIKQDPIKSQNILMKISDRNIALSMLYMDDNEKKSIFSLLSEKKVKRIKEELSYQKKLEINYKIYGDITKILIKHFNTVNKENKKQRTYIRPKNYKK